MTALHQPCAGASHHPRQILQHVAVVDVELQLAVVEHRPDHAGGPAIMEERRQQRFLDQRVGRFQFSEAALRP